MVSSRTEVTCLTGMSSRDPPPNHPLALWYITRLFVTVPNIPLTNVCSAAASFIRASL